MSLTAIICNPAFGFAGVGFPLIGMGLFPRLWGDGLPLRWFMQILFDQAVRGLPPAFSVQPLLTLGGLAAGFFLLSWLRLRALVKKGLSRPAEETVAEEAVSSPGVGARCSLRCAVCSTIAASSA